MLTNTLVYQRCIWSIKTPKEALNINNQILNQNNLQLVKKCNLSKIIFSGSEWEKNLEINLKKTP